MRILQIITLCELGGAQSVVVNLANSLCEKHEIIVAAGDGNGKMWDLLNPQVTIEHIPFLHRALSPIDEFKAIFSLKKIYKKYKPDIIHLHSSKVGILGRIAFPKSKILYTVHGFDSIRIAYRKYLPIERILQNRCQAIIGVSKYDKENLIKEKITNKISYIYNGINLPKATTDNNPFNNIPYKQKVLCIARLSAPKNVGLFFKVASLLPQYAFIWIGNQQPVQNKADNVFFMGDIPNAGNYNEYADLFFLPSNYEGLPIVIIEALACGKPVVASAVGGIPELLDGRNGFAVQNDANKLAEKIKLILSNEILKEKMSEAAKQTYLQKFTVDKMVDGYMAIYEKIYHSNQIKKLQ